MAFLERRSQLRPARPGTCVSPAHRLTALALPSSSGQDKENGEGRGCVWALVHLTLLKALRGCLGLRDLSGAVPHRGAP